MIGDVCFWTHFIKVYKHCMNSCIESAKKFLLLPKRLMCDGAIGQQSFSFRSSESPSAMSHRQKAKGRRKILKSNAGKATSKPHSTDHKVDLSLSFSRSYSSFRFFLLRRLPKLKLKLLNFPRIAACFLSFSFSHTNLKQINSATMIRRRSMRMRKNCILNTTDK